MRRISYILYRSVLQLFPASFTIYDRKFLVHFFKRSTGRQVLERFETGSSLFFESFVGAIKVDTMARWILKYCVRSSNCDSWKVFVQMIFVFSEFFFLWIIHPLIFRRLPNFQAILLSHIFYCSYFTLFYFTLGVFHAYVNIFNIIIFIKYKYRQINLEHILHLTVINHFKSTPMFYTYIRIQLYYIILQIFLWYFSPRYFHYILHT